MLQLSHIILILLNVLIFIIFQTIFFYFVGSKQIDIIVEDKMDIINTYLSYNTTAKNNLKTYLESNSDINTILENADEDEATRINSNLNLIGVWIGIPCVVIIILLIICAFIMYALKIKWTGIDNVGLILVLCAYLTEIVLYFGVIKKYNFIGDQTIYSFMYSLFSEQLKRALDDIQPVVSDPKDNS